MIIWWVVTIHYHEPFNFTILEVFKRNPFHLLLNVPFFSLYANCWRQGWSQMTMIWKCPGICWKSEQLLSQNALNGRNLPPLVRKMCRSPTMAHGFISGVPFLFPMFPRCHPGRIWYKRSQWQWPIPRTLRRRYGTGGRHFAQWCISWFTILVNYGDIYHTHP